MSNGQPIRALVVEDNPADAELIRIRLRNHPVEMHHVETLEAALAWLRANRTDAVLLDLHLPDSDGMSTVTAIRAVDDRVAILVLTGLDSDADGLDALQVGADEFISKTHLVAIPLYRSVLHAVERRKLEWQIYSVVWRDADPSLVLSEAGSVLFANPAASRLLGKEAADLLGLTVGPLSESGLSEVQVARGDGTILDAELRTTETTWRGERALLASIHDLADRKRMAALAVSKQAAERAQREAEVRLELILEQLAVAVWTTAPDLRITSHAGSTFDAGPEASEPRELRHLFGARVEAVESAHLAALANGEARFEFEHGGRAFHGQVRRHAAAGDGAERPGLLGIAVDATERRRLELQLRQAQKMEAIGRLAGGIAHDFNNLLTAICAFAEFIRDALTPADPPYRDAGEILRAAERAEGLTRQLLAFSKNQPIDPITINLNALVHTADRMLRRLLGSDILVETKLASDLWNVHLDPGVFEQVLINLCVNARDAMPDGGNLTVETANVVLDLDYSRAHGIELEPGEYVAVSVSDDGCGMSEEVKNQIFEPFFTTKEKGKGTGLGLPTCYGIVKQLHGFIWVYTEEGQGSTFKVYLPRDLATAVSIEARSSVTESRGGTETILVVEDDDQVRRLVIRSLEQQGYRIIDAANGGEALLICEQHTGTIDLLVTDVVMPKMSGRQLADRLAPLLPDTKVLFTSGYTENAIVHRGILDAGVALLQKPFTPETIARKVRAVLDADGYRLGGIRSRS